MLETQAEVHRREEAESLRKRLAAVQAKRQDTEEARLEREEEELRAQLAELDRQTGRQAFDNLKTNEHEPLLARRQAVFDAIDARLFELAPLFHEAFELDAEIQAVAARLEGIVRRYGVNDRRGPGSEPFSRDTYAQDYLRRAADRMKAAGKLSYLTADERNALKQAEQAGYLVTHHNSPLCMEWLAARKRRKAAAVVAFNETLTASVYAYLPAPWANGQAERARAVFERAGYKETTGARLDNGELIRNARGPQFDARNVSLTGIPFERAELLARELARALK